jgi:hypothetical protein
MLSSKLSAIGLNYCNVVVVLYLVIRCTIEVTAYSVSLQRASYSYRCILLLEGWPTILIGLLYIVSCLRIDGSLRFI